MFFYCLRCCITHTLTYTVQLSGWESGRGLFCLESVVLPRSNNSITASIAMTFDGVWRRVSHQNSVVNNQAIAHIVKIGMSGQYQSLGGAYESWAYLIKKNEGQRDPWVKWGYPKQRVSPYQLHPELFATLLVMFSIKSQRLGCVIKRK